MPKMKLDLPLGEYATVAERIVLFYQKHPRGRVLTRILSRDHQEVTVRATVYRDSEDLRPAASGLASEKFGDGEVNSVACVENTETSAIGRALANLGFTASGKRPSLEEMLKAEHARSRLSVVREVAQLAGEEKQNYANAVTDVLRLVNVAERHGMRPLRASTMRHRLQNYQMTPHLLGRIEQRLKRWVDRQTASELGVRSS